MNQIIPFPETQKPSHNSKELKELLSPLTPETRGVRVNQDIPDDLARQAPITERVTALLACIRKNQPVRSTNKGFLPRGIVLIMAKTAYAEAREHLLPVNREADLKDLHIERLIAEKAGLLKREKGIFSIPPATEKILEENKAGNLYSRLLEALLSHPSLLAKFDRLPDNTFLSHMPLFLLHLSRTNKPIFLWDMGLRTTETMDAVEIYQEESKEELMALNFLEECIHVRYLKRMAPRMGLLRDLPPRKSPLEEADLPPESSGVRELTRQRRRLYSWQATDLFRSALFWDLPEPKKFPLADDQAASIMADDAAHLLEYQDSLLSHQAKTLLHQALARDPVTLPAYFSLTLTTDDPKVLEQIVQEGIRQGKQLMNRGLSREEVLKSPDYRLWIRLKVVAGDMAMDKKDYSRAEEIFSEIQWEDVEIHHSLFASLIAQNKDDEAEDLMSDFPDEDEMEVLWNQLLLAYRRGGAKEAKAHLPAALEANPLIPGYLRRLASLPRPDLFSPPDDPREEDALLYLNVTRHAWKATKGVRQWLLNQTKNHK